MDYSPGDTGPDRIGGLPSHLPVNWPRCQGGQERLAFIAQIYSCDWFPLNGLFCLQFYACVERCHLEVDFLHMELVHEGALENGKKRGVAHPDLPVKTINYTPTRDSLDHDTFLEIISDDNQEWPVLKDEHLHKDRLSGIYTFDGYEGPVVNKTNRCIGQFRHPCDPQTGLYLFHSDTEGIYLHAYC